MKLMTTVTVFDIAYKLAEAANIEMRMTKRKRAFYVFLSKINFMFRKVTLKCFGQNQKLGFTFLSQSYNGSLLKMLLKMF